MRYLSENDWVKWILGKRNDCLSITKISMYKIMYLERYPFRSFKLGKFSDDETYLMPHKSYAPDSYKSIFNYPFIFSYIRDKFTISNVNNGKFGYAYCHPYEVPDLNIALGVAWTRYCGEEVPKIKKYLTKDEFANLDNGTYIFDEQGYKFLTIGKDPIFDNSVIAYTEDTKFTTLDFVENYFYKE